MVHAAAWKETLSATPSPFTAEQKARNFAYYEALTLRDSSLSACTQAVIAAEVGHLELAYANLAHCPTHMRARRCPGGRVAGPARRGLPAPMSATRLGLRIVKCSRTGFRDDLVLLWRSTAGADRADHRPA